VLTSTIDATVWRGAGPRLTACAADVLRVCGCARALPSA